MLSSLFHGFRLQPILEVSSDGAVVSHSFEVLSTPKEKSVTIDELFSFLPVSIHRSLIITQVSLFSRMDCNYFINIPVSLWLDSEFVDSLCAYRLNNLSFEIQDSYKLLSLTKIEIGLVSQSIKKFKELGSQVWIDDINEEYYDISILLGVTGVKLDKKFVWNSPMLVEVIKDFHELGLVVLAEGVENINVLNRLVSSHIDYVQGFLWPEINISLDGNLTTI
ncbi:diguanylate cyclase/phosphodiesterase [Vibrio cholerae]|uniref:Diguanylate cyclase/phosphodiesterase n=1 Tax=Vibrio cholerae TaxID=666 RepID=A0A655X390_VIBCL|nr:EAL domain-containing protein [Vibrio cholerae]CSC04837.1 diguanylate cyclase/phosphodiesterase [Vibrio cholerae]CSE24573.1 diguanylate cyclase/phosphodiesterase [Vibrio cholerae]